MYTKGYYMSLALDTILSCMLSIAPPSNPRRDPSSNNAQAFPASLSKSTEGSVYSEGRYDHLYEKAGATGAEEFASQTEEGTIYGQQGVICKEEGAATGGKAQLKMRKV